MKKVLSIAVLSAISLCSQAQAADISYNYVQAALINMNVDTKFDEDVNLSADLKGYNLKASFSAGDNFYIFGGYRDVNDDITYEESTLDYGVAELNVGLGYRLAATENTDWLFEVEYLNDEISAGLDGLNGSIDSDGYRIGVGLRGKASDKVELYGKVNYSDLGKVSLGDGWYFDFGNGIGAELGAIIGLNETWGVIVEYQLDNREDTDFSQFGLGVRASF